MSSKRAKTENPGTDKNKDGKEIYREIKVNE